MDTLYMIKYGKKEHLDQLIDGNIRFAPSQTYIRIEEALHDKGQGDLLEGKMKINFTSAELYHPDTGELLGTLSNQTLILSIEDVNSMPVFCLSQYSCTDTKNYINNSDYIMSINNLNCITHDFPDADYALIILEPDRFINDVSSIAGHSVVAGEVKYFDYDINPIQMYTHLTGESNIVSGQQHALTYENRYRHLLCKDASFSNQQEFRFILLNEKIEKPQFYNFNFTSKYFLVPISELNNDIPVRL